MDRWTGYRPRASLMLGPELQKRGPAGAGVTQFCIRRQPAPRPSRAPGPPPPPPSAWPTALCLSRSPHGGPDRGPWLKGTGLKDCKEPAQPHPGAAQGAGAGWEMLGMQGKACSCVGAAPRPAAAQQGSQQTQGTTATNFLGHLDLSWWHFLLMSTHGFPATSLQRGRPLISQCHAKKN